MKFWHIIRLANALYQTTTDKIQPLTAKSSIFDPLSRFGIELVTKFAPLTKSGL
jgi:hypothetical protein